ncbi:MAG: hypothetical protein ABR905_01395 [Terracidiphilus sp.]
MRLKKIIAWTAVTVAIAIAVVLLVLRMHQWRPRSMTIEGATIQRDEDTRKELPISGVVVTGSDGVQSTSALSDANGYFKLTSPGVVWLGRTVNLSFRHPGYQPLDLKVETTLRRASRELYVAAMTPIAKQPTASSTGPVSAVTHIRVRYTVNSETEENIGSAVKTFQVFNKGNVPCDGRSPCAPNGSWKASSTAVSLDAGTGKDFRNIRASCIAGPCPFTRIDLGGFVDGDRTITVTAWDWSDTATFLLEAEVFQTIISSNVRELYPVVVGQTLNFTLPPTQEGVSIEAEMDGEAMVFPLGPDLYLSWATCAARTSIQGRQSNTVYRCELKPGYRF